MKSKLHDELIDYDAVARLHGGDPPPCRSTIWRRVKAKQLPPPVKVGPNTVRWWKGEVLAHLEALPRQTYRAPEASAEAASPHSP
jgi:predicted DNA-binding transcriptional regulator AlpA